MQVDKKIARDNETFALKDVIHKNLCKDGIAKISWLELFGEKPDKNVLFNNIFEHAQNIVTTSKERSSKSISVRDKDSFSVRDGQYFGFPNPFLLSLGMSKPLYSIVQSYLGLGAYLFSAENWFHTSSFGFEKVSAQNWHRDPEAKRILKIFCLLQDVGIKNGPTEMLPGSHRTGERARLSNYRKNSVHLPQDEIGALIKDKDIHPIKCTGSKGDIFFIDTSSIHKGGWCEESRLLSQLCFLPRKRNLLRNTVMTPAWVR